MSVGGNIIDSQALSVVDSQLTEIETKIILLKNKHKNILQQDPDIAELIKDIGRLRSHIINATKNTTQPDKNGSLLVEDSAEFEKLLDSVISESPQAKAIEKIINSNNVTMIDKKTDSTASAHKSVDLPSKVGDIIRHPVKFILDEFVVLQMLTQYTY